MFPLSAVCREISQGFLTEHLIRFGRTHILTDLLTLCIPIENDFREIASDLTSLEGYAVAIRYPGAIVSVEMAEEAFKRAGQIRNFVRRKLKLE
jgi:HEPN domain-containing protein